MGEKRDNLCLQSLNTIIRHRAEARSVIYKSTFYKTNAPQVYITFWKNTRNPWHVHEGIAFTGSYCLKSIARHRVYWQHRSD